MTSLEVVEHVADPAAFVAALAAAVADGGLLILSTPNRTQWSKLVMIGIGEGLGQIPKGTHDWNKFIAPGRARRDGAGGRAGGDGRHRARLVARPAASSSATTSRSTTC